MIKLNYVLKVLCGDFIDDRKGAIPFFVLFILGILTGVILGIVVYNYKEFTLPLRTGQATATLTAACAS